MISQKEYVLLMVTNLKLVGKCINSFEKLMKAKIKLEWRDREKRKVATSELNKP